MLFSKNQLDFHTAWTLGIVLGGIVLATLAAFVPGSLHSRLDHILIVFGVLMLTLGADGVVTERRKPELRAQLRLSITFLAMGISMVIAHGWPSTGVREVASWFETLSLLGGGIVVWVMASAARRQNPR